jgi:tRNA(Phe) wybutosine-synthesizing methylase Tyw3
MGEDASGPSGTQITCRTAATAKAIKTIARKTAFKQSTPKGADRTDHAAIKLTNRLP